MKQVNLFGEDERVNKYEPSEQDLEVIKRVIEKQSWRGTTHGGSYHEYIVRKDCVDEDFVVFAKACQAGERRSWTSPTGYVGRYNYIDIGDYAYWTMGSPIWETIIINRCILADQTTMKPCKPYTPRKNNELDE